jgi:ribonuclease HI
MKRVEIFTDGACLGNPGAGGWGVILRYNQVEKELSGGEPNTTNNRMELTAIMAATIMYGWHTKRNEYVYIYTDSTYAKQCLTTWWMSWVNNNWKTSTGSSVKNKDIIEPLIHLVYYNNRKYIQPWALHIEYVPGHSGDLGNELADKLATGELTCEEVMKRYSLDRLGVQDGEEKN